MDDQPSFAAADVPQGHLIIAGITRARFSAGDIVVRRFGPRQSHDKPKRQRDGGWRFSTSTIIRIPGSIRQIEASFTRFNQIEPQLRKKLK
jgi:hypothetical protein